MRRPSAPGSNCFQGKNGHPFFPVEKFSGVLFFLKNILSISLPNHFLLDECQKLI